MRSIQFKVGLFFLLIGLAMAGLLAYLAYAKGFFEHQRAVVVTASDAEDIEVGMPLVYSGIAIGKVHDLSLTPQGQIRVRILVPTEHAKWLRSDSTFWLDRPLLGKAKIRVFTKLLAGPPLPPDAVRPLNGVDEQKDSAQLVSKVGIVLDNVIRLTKADGNLERTFAHMESLSARLAGSGGMLEGVLGSREKAERVLALVDQTHVLLRQFGEVAKRVDALAQSADQKLFARDKVADQLSAVLADTTKLLTRADDNLKKVDAILADVKSTSGDLPRLRDEVESTLNKTETLIDEVNDLWPIAKPKDLRLP